VLWANDDMRRELMKMLFRISLVLMLATLGALIAIDLHLRNPVSPQGVVSFELCAYTRSCRTIVEAWGPGGQVWAALSLGVDYLFMFLYAATIFLGLLLFVVRVPERLKILTIGAALAVWGAGAADALENYCLAQMLVNPAAGGYAWPAAIFATIKFIVLGATLGWWLLMTVRFARGSARAALGGKSR
jgi:hypothetical protein